MEGKKTLVSNYQYERDPRARAECIRLFGTTCVICGFNFGATYGELGEGFIHVHHLTPVAERGEKYEIKPESDLRPVCPNCHAMLHRNSPPYTIEELQHLLRR